MTDDHEQLDPAEALMREVGAQLRQVRLERGEELDEVAEHLRIKSTYLFGIEQGDLSRMPGRTYALGFLRSYADYLGFDGDDLIVQIKSTVANLTDRTRLRIRTPLPESRLPKAPILVLSLAAIAALYAGWSYLGQSGQLAIETVAEVPSNLRSMALDALNEERAPVPQPAPPVVGATPPITTAPAGSAAPPSANDAPPPAREQAAPRSVQVPPAQVAAPATGTPARASAEASVERPAAPAASPPEHTPATDDPGLPALQPEAGAARQLAATEPAGGMPRIAAGPDEPVPAAPGGPTDGSAPAAAPAAAPVEDLARRADGRQLLTAALADAPVPAEETLAALSPGAGLPDAAGQVYETENTDARVVLRALGSSWIRVSSLSGDYLRTRTLEPGDVFLVPNRSDLELWTGNAGGIEVVLDGAVLAPIGNDGAVVREVPLDPPSLRARFGRP